MDHRVEHHDRLGLTQPRNTMSRRRRNTTDVKYGTERLVRATFWKEHSEMLTEHRTGKRHADYSPELQRLFDDFVDELLRADEIGPDLAGVVTLG